MKTQEPINLLDQIGAKLVLAQQELDELAIQLTLGKAEARDKFEEVKKEFREKVLEFKNHLRTSKESIKPEVLQRLDEFELQLALGKAETRDLFEEQKQKISQALTRLEEEWNQWRHNLNTDFFRQESEKFKLKLDILRLRFELKAFQAKDSYRSTTINVRRELERIISRIQQRVQKGSDKYSDFKDELALSYKHFKKAVSDLV